jgi:ankyrin repeat protein
VNEWTALHHASEVGHIDVVRTLLEHKANPQARNKERESCVDLTKNKAVIQLLQSASAGLLLTFVVLF